ncbi:MAG: serine/threonine protein kinase [Phycisphaeraceae bacterium]|nr:serine/threonine protein kinase [Phycisphaeraceae bacterium]
MAEPTEERLIAMAVARYFGNTGPSDGAEPCPPTRPSVDALLDELFPSVNAEARASLRTSLIGAISGASRASHAERDRHAAIGTDLGSSIPEVPGYDLIEEIGRGGMGVVYEGYQRSTGRRVAVKFMRGSGRDLSLRFEREIDLLARLSHPGIVSVIDSGATADRYYYVMEYVEGRPLDQHLTPGTSEPRTVLKLLADIADVVNDAHQRGVLHRDLKPANILVESNGRIRLLDFGLAKAIDPDTGVNAELTISEAGRPMGTLAYMPPEQASGGSSGISVRSDVYALGVIGYYLLSGRHPIDVDGKLLDVIKRIQHEQPDRPSSIRNGLGADIDAMIGKATSKLPQDRYATASEFGADIRRYLAGLPIEARRVSDIVRSWRWIKRNRALAAVVCVSALLVVSFGVAAFLRVVDERDKARRIASHSMRELSRLQSSEESTRAAVTEARELYGENSAVYADALIRLALVMERSSQHTAAALEAGRALEIVKRILPESDPLYSMAHLHYGRMIFQPGRYIDSEPVLREAVRLLEAHPAFDGLALAQARMYLGSALHQIPGRMPEAERYLRESYEWYRQHPDRDDGYMTGVLRMLASAIANQGRVEEGEAELLRALHEEEQRELPDPARRLRLLLFLADYYTAGRRMDEAAVYREKAQADLAKGIDPFSVPTPAQRYLGESEADPR